MKRTALTRVGLEFEYLAPVGTTRLDVAQWLANALGGTVEGGLKYHSEGRAADGRPICFLTRAFRVKTRAKKVWTTIVDDNTIRETLRPTPTQLSRFVTDDLRLALVAEKSSWIPFHQQSHQFDSMLSVFTSKWHGNRMLDPYGHVLFARDAEPVSFQRVVEVVTAVQTSITQREKTVELVVQMAKELRLKIPLAGAFHVHFDAAPFQNIGLMSRLIQSHSEEKSLWHQTLKPNLNCKKLGEFPELVQRVAKESARTKNWNTFAAALRLAGAHKSCDINILGAIEPHPKQATVEIRCLPMLLTSDGVFESIKSLETLLLEV